MGTFSLLTSASRRSCGWIAMVCLPLLLCLAQVRAQDDGERSAARPSSVRPWLQGLGRLRVPSAFERNHRAVKEAFRDVVRQSGRSVVRVISAGSQVAYGCVVDSQGWVLTKASELDGDLQCQLYDGRRVAAKRIAYDDASDLALLQLEVDSSLPPVEWQETPPAVGSWLACVGLGQLPVATGVLSNTPRPIARGVVFLGVMLEDTPQGPRIARVIENTAASEAGVKVGDWVVKVDSQPADNRDHVLSAIRMRRPGDRLKLLVRRPLKTEPEGRVQPQADAGDKPPAPPGKPQPKLADGAGQVSSADTGPSEEIELSAILGNRLEQQKTSENLTGPLNHRRGDFEEAMQHDAVLSPQDCGGPLVDLDGKVVGINIARAGRVETYALPSKLARSVLASLRLQAARSAHEIATQQERELKQRIAQWNQELGKELRAVLALQNALDDAERRVREQPTSERALGELKQVRESLTKAQSAAAAIESRLTQAAQELERRKPESKVSVDKSDQR